MLFSADVDGQLEVASCTSMEVKDETRACDNMFDGSLSRNVKDGVCMVTKSNYKGWAEVKLAQTSVVKKNVLLSKGNGKQCCEFFFTFLFDSLTSL